MNWIGEAQQAKQENTPVSGVNLCMLDDYDFPPDNLALVGNYNVRANAISKARDIWQDHGMKIVLMYPNGTSEIFNTKAELSARPLREGSVDQPRDDHGP